MVVATGAVSAAVVVIVVAVAIERVDGGIRLAIRSMHHHLRAH